MASSTKKKLLQTVAVDLGCSCGRSKLSTIFWPKSKPNKSKFFHHHHQKLYQSSSSSLEASGLTSIEEDDSNVTNTTFSPIFDSTPFFSESEEPTNSTKSFNNGYSRIGESIAVVKDSNDPYDDFRTSMLQMIWEKEIYAREDLSELLDCFLSLNSPYHHEIILRVFREICNDVFSSSSITDMNHHHHHHHQHQGYSWNSKKGST